MISFQKVRKYCVYEASQQYKHAVYGGHDLCLCPQVKLPLWYLLPGGDELLHWLLKVLQASEFLLSVCALFFYVCTVRLGPCPCSNNKRPWLDDFR